MYSKCQTVYFHNPKVAKQGLLLYSVEINNLGMFRNYKLICFKSEITHYLQVFEAYTDPTEVAASDWGDEPLLSKEERVRVRFLFDNFINQPSFKNLNVIEFNLLNSLRPWSVDL